MMADTPLDSARASVPGMPRVRNPRTQSQIRRDLIWQIALPLGVAVVAAIVPLVLLILPGGAPVRSAWADVSLIFLILPTAVFGLVALALVAALIFAAFYGLRELPYLFKRAQDFMALVSYRVEAGADKAASPFLALRSFTAGLKRVAQDVRDLFN